MKLRAVRWRIAPRGAARDRTIREAIVVQVERASGAVGYGEAAPLDGSIGPALRSCFADGSPIAIGGSPAMRFAIETAELDALARERGIPLAAVLGDPVASLPLARKLKVGAAGDLDAIRAFAAANPGPFRIDANRRWPRERVREWMAAIADLPIEFVEEPCPNAHELLDDDLPIRIALDESLAERPLRFGRQLAAVVLKPTVLGLARCRELAAEARARGVTAIVTHALEGPIGTAACAHFALALGGTHAVGLAPHSALDAWDVAMPMLRAETARGDASRGCEMNAFDARAHAFASSGAGCVVLTDAPGLGLDVAALEDAIVELREPLSSDDVHVRAMPRCLVAVPARATIDTIHAAFDARRPLALLHPRATDAERDRQRALAESAELEDGEVVLFTSGSTGVPRGVVLSRGALIAAAEASASHLGWHDGDRWLLALPMAHAGGLAIVVRCLAARREVELVEDPRGLAAGLARCTLASLVPTQLAQLLDDPRWTPPPRLRAVLLGGTAAAPSLLDAAAARGVPFLATYGLTETFGQIATAPLERIGRPTASLVPLANVTIEAGTAAGPARIRIRTPQLATRYLDGEPIAPTFATADLGYLDGNALHVVGRADDVIITGGENVHPLEVEAVLAATPGVRAACAFGIVDERWGQRVAAAIAVDGSFELASALVRWRAALPPHARPREIATVHDLPVSPNGKLDRRAARLLPRAPV